MIDIVLPWPPNELSPNGRNHWAKVARAKKAYRASCSLAAIAHGAKRIKAEKLHISLTFYPPNKRRHDLDNLLARMKSGIDGIADALGVDDSNFSLSIYMAGMVGGFVAVQISKPNFVTN